LFHQLRGALAGLQARFGWNWIGFAFSATIVGISLYVLRSMLKDIDFASVAANIRAVPHANLMAAGFFVACAYVTLTGYDLFALRTIGASHVPYRIAALSSFTSYAIGHNIGATAFSGGAIRYRIYSQFGLGVIDVVKICFLTGLTFWLGNFAMLGTGMSIRPQAPSRILLLPPDVVRGLGIAALVALVGYAVWVWRRPRTLGFKKLRIAVPGLLSTLVQIGIGVADLSFSSLAMYNLVPADTDGLVSVATAFVSATLLGFASHAPGSLGVFEAAMLVALPQVGKEELVAGLLIFRMLYFLLPFTVALVTMACWEALLFYRRSRDDKESDPKMGCIVEPASAGDRPMPPHSPSNSGVGR
jgi:uncharacterized membrane protein YbhN (UPF0104 family)